MKEIWRVIDGFNGCFSVSNTGKVKSHKRKGVIRDRILKTGLNTKNYYRVTLCAGGVKKLMYVHQLIAIYFIENPKNHKYINHIDGNPRNNSLSNLEWCDIAHNVRHAYRIGLIKPNIGEKNPMAKMSKAEAREVKMMISMGYKNIEIQNKLNLTKSQVEKIKSNKTWRHINV